MPPRRHRCRRPCIHFLVRFSPNPIDRRLSSLAIQRPKGFGLAAEFARVRVHARALAREHEALFPLYSRKCAQASNGTPGGIRSTLQRMLKRSELPIYLVVLGREGLESLRIQAKNSDPI